jgi:hypothetical protein
VDNQGTASLVVLGMEQIEDAYAAEPGLVVLDVTAADEATVKAVMYEPEWIWTPSGIGRVRREPGKPGVKARVYADAYAAEPGLVVLDVTAADEATVKAVMYEPEWIWAPSGIGRVRREPGKPGVKARVYADVRRPGSLDDQPAVSGAGSIA